MPQRHTVRRSFALVAAAGTVALGLTACGGSSDEGSDAPGAAASATLPSVSADEALAAQVPEAIAEDGTITIGTDSTYAPSEFLAADGTTIEGFDVDLFTLVAQKLGLEVDFQTASFDSIIAGVDSGKYEVGVSSFTINPDRLAQVTMVSYFSAGTQWAVKSGNPEDVDPDDACGKSVAVQTGTVQVDDVTARSQACTDAGKPEITIDQYESQADATAAVVSGKDDAGLADSPVIAYAVSQTNGQLELAGDIYDSAPYGYVVPQAETEFAQAIADAVQSLIDDGSYDEVLQKWGVEAGAIDDPTVNPQVS
ncbi:amino acid ABC transporter substrate-binding protein, PAAT family (TC 3.A.1.3.-) [Klenkia soli]|uniref:Amino acid ABC transporter substrate-binding protein, PAAT family (TC 3.A.1.3.-) n=1 Tax=Klenkia soli TaxID=1052260 RepID=A0A1H0JJ71_9ACTN|nr:ABC transporter substrate-binding protein [Klenkia soli]SDO43479.1 amino acid ABC transporter substrate-binding protein, PAAT family (TC 3.A.1.3.-) [Klenkia soli]